jgi:hypothetical protein
VEKQNKKTRAKMKRKKYVPSKEDNTAVLLLLIFSACVRVMMMFVPYIPGFDFLMYFLDLLIALSLLWFLAYYWRIYNERRKHTGSS